MNYVNAEVYDSYMEVKDLVGEKPAKLLNKYGWQTTILDSNEVKLVHLTPKFGYKVEIPVFGWSNLVKDGFLKAVYSALDLFDPGEFAYDLIIDGNMPTLSEIEDDVDSAKEALELCNVLSDAIIKAFRVSADSRYY